MIGCYKTHASLFEDCLRHTSYAGIHGFDGLNGCFHHAGVPDHVTVGKIEHDDIVFTAVYALHNPVGDLTRAHLRLEVIGCYLRRGDKHPVLPLIALLNAAVEKESDVCIFLGLGYSQLLQTLFTDIFTKGIRKRLRMERHLHIGHRDVILRHAYEKHGEKAPLSLKTSKVGVDDGAGDFTRPVGSEIEKYDRVAL